MEWNAFVNPVILPKLLNLSGQTVHCRGNFQKSKAKGKMKVDQMRKREERRSQNDGKKRRRKRRR